MADKAVWAFAEFLQRGREIVAKRNKNKNNNNDARTGTGEAAGGGFGGCSRARMLHEESHSTPSPPHQQLLFMSKKCFFLPLYLLILILVTHQLLRKEKKFHLSCFSLMSLGQR